MGLKGLIPVFLIPLVTGSYAMPGAPAVYPSPGPPARPEQKSSILAVASESSPSIITTAAVTTVDSSYQLAEPTAVTTTDASTAVVTGFPGMNASQIMSAYTSLTSNVNSQALNSMNAVMSSAAFLNNNYYYYANYYVSLGYAANNGTSTTSAVPSVTSVVPDHSPSITSAVSSW